QRVFSLPQAFATLHNVFSHGGTTFAPQFACWTSLRLPSGHVASNDCFLLRLGESAGRQVSVGEVLMRLGIISQRDRFQSILFCLLVQDLFLIRKRGKATRVDQLSCGKCIPVGWLLRVAFDCSSKPFNASADVTRLSKNVGIDSRGDSSLSICQR